MFWTVDEIHSCPMFGRGTGWFYGLVRDRWRLQVVEILPGLGYTAEWFLWDPRWMRNRDVWKDLLRTPSLKRKYVGRRSKEQQEADEAHMNEEIKNARPIEELFAEFGFKEGD